LKRGDIYKTVTPHKETVLLI